MMTLVSFRIRICAETERELAESEKALTSEDKKDIDASAALVVQIPKHKTKLDELNHVVSGESVRLQSLENKLKRIKAMEGYPKEKLSTFKTWGWISLVAGLILLIYGIVSRQDVTQVNNTLPAIAMGIGAVALVIGAVLLWLRYTNEKKSDCKKSSPG